jgi:hypothetical protein
VKKYLYGLLLLLGTWGVFYGSPVAYVTDSAYSMLMDEAILHHGTPDMIAYQVVRGDGPGFYNGYPWQLAILKGRLLYTWPWGAALLSLPAVALLNIAGMEVAPNHVYSAAREIRMQRIVSTILCAIEVCLLYAMAAQLLPEGWSIAIAISAAFGTQIWSSLSRSVWPQTWYLVLITIVILLLLMRSLRPLLLATVLAWAAFVRPAGLPTLILVGTYVLVEFESNRSRAFYVAAATFWALTFASVMLFFTGRLVAPAYHANWFVFYGFMARLEGILFSPSRGLLIYEPVILIPLYLAIRYWRELPRRRLAALALAGTASVIAVLGCYRIWWGWSYGPRDLAETIPWLVLLAILGVRAFIDDTNLTMRECAAVISIAMLLATASVAINSPGALSYAANAWNTLPIVDYTPERLWDWQHPQFLAWIQSG